MNNYLYPSSCGDFYPKTWTDSGYRAQMDAILNDSEDGFLATDHQEFRYLSTLEKIIQVVKGWLGFGNTTSATQVQSELLKFLYHGEAQGFIHENMLKKLTKANPHSPFKHPALQGLVNEILNRHKCPSIQASNASLAKMRIMVVGFHRTHKKALCPHFWSRSVTNPCLARRQLIEFGDAPLILFKHAAKSNHPSLALSYLVQAHALHNHSVTFQEKLWNHLQSFLDQYPKEALNAAVHDIILDLATTAFQNGQPVLAQKQLHYSQSFYQELQGCIGEIFLNFEQYDDAKPYLPLLQKRQQAEMQAKIGDAYWHLKQIPTAILSYEAASRLYQRQEGVENSKKIAALETRIGDAYVDHMTDQLPAKAIEHFSKACLHDKNEVTYQQKLYQAYFLQYETCPQDFELNFGASFHSFIKNCNQAVVKDNQKMIQKILLDCVEQALPLKRPTHMYVDQALALYGQNAIFICTLIDLLMQHKATEQLVPKLNQWNQQFANWPQIKERIGTIYWLSQNQEAAIKCYQEAIQIYESENQKSSQEKAALLRAQVARHLLEKPTSWFSTFKEQALTHLQKATEAHSIHAEELATVYILLANQESQKNVLLRSRPKMIEYYQKAYDLAPQNGAHLSVLFEFYFSKGEGQKKAVALYQHIQTQTWAKELKLSAETHYKLAQCLNAHDEEHAALVCFKNASELDPNNRIYRKTFLQQVYDLANFKIQQAEDTENLDDKILLLKNAIVALEGNYLDGLAILKDAYRQLLVKAYASLAQAYITSLEIAPLWNRMQWEQHKSAAQKALECYDKALIYDPKDAVLHFEKALLIDELFAVYEHDFSYADAIKEYELAIQYSEHENPFYYSHLATLYDALFEDEKCKEIRKKIPQFSEDEANERFYQHYRIFWRPQLFCKKDPELPLINPHAYKIVQSGLISVTRKIVIPQIASQ